MEYKPLGSMVNRKIGYGIVQPGQSVPDGVPVIKVNNLISGLKSPSELDTTARENEAKYSRTRLHGGELIVSVVGTIGKTAIVPKSFAGCNLVRATALIDIEDELMSKWVKYYFDSPCGQSYIEQNLNTTVQPTLNIKSLVEMPIPIRDTTEMEKTVLLLSALDEKIEVNRQINDNLRQQAQALFKKWFVDNPDAILWKEGTFSNLIEKTISGDWGKDSPSGNNTEMVYCIRGADIPEVRAGNKGKMPTRYILPKNYAAKQLVDGDIVVEISGGSPTQSTGRAAAVSDALLARYDKGMVCTNFCKALKPRAGYSMYVYYYWQYLYDRDIFFSYENGTTGIKNLDINGFIETEPIVIAPEDLVEKFDAVCQTVFSKIYANGMENEQLALVRDTILPKLMSGEIDVSAVQL